LLKLQTESTIFSVAAYAGRVGTQGKLIEIQDADDIAMALMINNERRLVRALLLFGLVAWAVNDSRPVHFKMIDGAHRWAGTVPGAVLSCGTAWWLLDSTARGEGKWLLRSAC
jgi:hypothetical protein